MKLIAPQNLGRGRRCTITNRTKDPDGFITTGTFVKEQNGYDQEVVLSAAVVRECARLLGMHGPETVKELEEQLVALGDSLTEAHARLDDLTQLNDLTQKVTA